MQEAGPESRATVLMPHCGITYGDVLDVATACRSQKHAAELLGVDYAALRRALRRWGLNIEFGGLRHTNITWARPLTEERILAVSHLGGSEAANILGVSRRHIYCEMQRLGMESVFGNGATGGAR